MAHSDAVPIIPDPDQTPARPHLRPIPAFLIGLVVIASLGIPLALLTSDPNEPPATRQPTGAISAQEAEAIFIELEELQLLAYSNRDLSLLSRIYTPDSPLLPITRREIRSLFRNGVISRPHVDQLSLKPVTLETDKLVLREESLLSSTFESEKGKDVTNKGGTQRLIIVWTLIGSSNGWRIHDSIVVEAENVQP